MSASTSTRRARQENVENAPQETPPALATTDTSEAALRTVTVEIANLQVTLPLKFAAGHVLTDNQAKVLDAAYQRQFTNNQNAIAKAKVTWLEQHPTASEADKAKYAPDTAAVIASRYEGYEPNVGGGPRLGSMEKMRLDAAWRAWVKLVTEHNESVKVGGEPVIAKAGSKPVAIQSAPRKAKDQSEDAHKAAVEAFTTARDAFKAKMLTLPAYADRIQAELDAIMAERGASKTETAVEAVTASDELI